jgi:RHS repeat-associated protein
MMLDEYGPRAATGLAQPLLSGGASGASDHLAERPEKQAREDRRHEVGQRPDGRRDATLAEVRHVAAETRQRLARQAEAGTLAPGTPSEIDNWRRVRTDLERARQELLADAERHRETLRTRRRLRRMLWKGTLASDVVGRPAKAAGRAVTALARRVTRRQAATPSAGTPSTPLPPGMAPARHYWLRSAVPTTVSAAATVGMTAMLAPNNLGFVVVTGIASALAGLGLGQGWVFHRRDEIDDEAPLAALRTLRHVEAALDDVDQVLALLGDPDARSRTATPPADQAGGSRRRRWFRRGPDAVAGDRPADPADSHFLSVAVMKHGPAAVLRVGAILVAGKLILPETVRGLDADLLLAVTAALEAGKEAVYGVGEGLYRRWAALRSAEGKIVTGQDKARGLPYTGREMSEHARKLAAEGADLAAEAKLPPSGPARPSFVRRVADTASAAARQGVDRTTSAVRRAWDGTSAAARSGWETVVARGRKMASVARWGLANPRANGIEAIKRLVRFDPIDVATGDMVLTQTDVELPGALPLLLSRTHLSSYRLGGWFGRSWASTLDQRLEVDGTGAYFATADGMVLVYPAGDEGGPARLPVEGPRWPLHRQTDGRYTVTDPWQGVSWHFAPVTDDPAAPLPLVAMTDRNGHRIDLHHDRYGTLLSVTHSGGYRILVEVDGDRIVGLSLAGVPDEPDGSRLVRFRYDDAGDLVEVINSSGLPLRYEYDADGRIVRWVDRNHTEYHYTYGPDGRCVATGGTGDFLAGRLDYDHETRTTTVVDSLGHVTRYRFNELMQVESVTDPLGHETRYTWDRYDRKLSETDPLGRTTRYGYDEAGNLVEVVRPDGSRATATYNALHQPVEVVDFDGAVWRRDYDERGNLVSVTDPTGATTRYRHDGSGHLVEVVDPLGGVLRIDTDPAGLVRRVVDANGAVTTYRRDPAGRVVEITDPVGGVTRLGYTPEGRLAWRRSPGGAVEQWRYDAEGNLVGHTDPTGARTEFEIGAFDLPVARTDPDGRRLTFGYDTELRLTTVTNPQGLTWRYAYDPAGRLVAETDFNGRTRTYLRDAAGQVVAQTNGVGQRVDLVRDVLGNVVEKRAPEGVTRFGYDPVGRLTYAATPEVELRWERDPLGRVLAEIRDGVSVTSTYDRVGRRIRRRTPSGVESVWEYDAGHRPVALHTGGETIRFGHDAGGREVRRSVGALVFDRAWDADHRLLSQVVVANPGGAPGAPTDIPRTIAEQAYRYRTDGHLLAVADRLTGGRELELDRAGRVTAVRAAGWTERYAYDEVGNLVHADWPEAAPGADARGERRYRGTLIRRAGGVRYEYDDAGRVTLRQRTRHSAKPLTWRYTWDSEDRLVGVTTPDGTRWRYRYDALGRRVGKQRLDADGGVAEQVDYHWDGALLVEQVHRGPAGGRVSTWEYAPGSFTPVSQTDGLVDPDDPAEVDRRFYAIVADLVGTPTELVTPDGEVAWRQRTTIWGVPTHATDTGVDCPLRFPGQIHDPETGTSYNHHRYYDPDTGRYQSPDPLGLLPGPDPHAYVPNPTVQIDPLGLAPAGCGGPIRVSPSAQDWGTKGVHVHDGRGGIGAEPIRLRSGVATPQAVQWVIAEIHSNPQLRADLIDKARGAMGSMNSGEWGMGRNRAAELHFLIRALEQMG